MRVTKAQLNKIVREEIEKKLDEGIMDTLKSAGSAVKKAFTGDKLPPLGHMQAGNAASRKLDVEVKKIYLDVLADPRKFKDFFPTFLGFHSIAEKSRGADAAAASKKIYNKLKSSGLYRNLRSLMQNGKLYLGESSGRMKDWKGDINPIEKENYVISPWVANIVLQSGNIYDLEESDRNGYMPPGYGDIPAEEEGSEQASAEQMNESKMKITKTQLKQIIKEVISEAWDDNDDEWLTPDEMRKSPRSKMMGPSPIDGQEDPSDTEGGYTMASDTEALYDRYWELAVEDYHQRSSNIDQYYEDYDPNSSDDKVHWRLRFAISHLNSLLGRNPQPTDEEIIDAIHEGWHEGDYSREEQEDMDRDY